MRHDLAENTVNYISFARLAHVLIVSLRTLSCEFALTQTGEFVSCRRTCLEGSFGVENGCQFSLF